MSKGFKNTSKSITEEQALFPLLSFSVCTHCSHARIFLHSCSSRIVVNIDPGTSLTGFKLAVDQPCDSG